MADKLDASLDKERIYNHMQLVLDKMNLPMRTVFELFTNEGLTTEEIADIRKTTLDQVEELLASARQLLKNSFEKRFLIDSN